MQIQAPNSSTESDPRYIPIPLRIGHVSTIIAATPYAFAALVLLSPPLAAWPRKIQLATFLFPSLMSHLQNVRTIVSLDPGPFMAGEFLAMHSAILLGSIACCDETRAKKIQHTIWLTAIYALFAVIFSVAMGQWWMLFALLALSLTKLLHIAIGTAPTLVTSIRMQRQWLANCLIFMGCLTIWRGQMLGPYFLLLCISELIDHSWIRTRRPVTPTMFGKTMKPPSN